jgi:cobalt-zinc-cadmium efflux system outer membrane protein
MRLRQLSIVFAVASVALPSASVARAEPVANTAAPAGAEPTFSIEAAVAAMRRSHPLLRAAASSIRAAEGNAVTAGHWANPVLDATYYQALQHSSYDPLGTPAVGVTQFLELAGTPAARRRSARSEARATASDRDALARDLEWNVREAFVKLATSYERQRIHRDAIADLERAAGIVRSRVSSGIVPRYDASRIQLVLAQAQADLGDAEADTARVRGELDVAVGPAGAELVGVPKLDLTDVPPAPPLQESLEAARSRRPDIAAARHRVDAADQNVDVAKRSVFPGVGVRVGAGWGQSTGQLDVGAGVTIPLPLLERGQGTIRAAEAQAEGHRYLVEAMSTAAVQRVQAAHAEYGKRLDALIRFRDQISTVGSGMHAEAEAGYREAKLSVLELVDAYHSLRDARLRLVELTEGTHLARLGLGRAIGAQDSK